MCSLEVSCSMSDVIRSFSREIKLAAGYWIISDKKSPRLGRSLILETSKSTICDISSLWQIFVSPFLITCPDSSDSFHLLSRNLRGEAQYPGVCAMGTVLTFLRLPSGPQILACFFTFRANSSVEPESLELCGYKILQRVTSGS